MKIRFLLVSLIFAWLRLAAATETPKPNLVIFVTDDHTALDSAVYGAKDVRTPNMTRLAAAGLVFERAFVASPTCAPSRGAMLTGLMPVRNGAEPNHSRPRDEIKKLPAYLQELGYEVVSFGKVSHYGHTQYYGFDHWAHDKYHEDVAIPNGLKWLRERKSTKPLCLFLGTNWPHVPWPDTGEGHKPEDVRLPPTAIDTPKTREVRARYYAAIGRMDTELGQAFDTAYEVLGRNTFFLTTSDNGAQWPFGKWSCYDAGIRTPMIAVWPGQIAAGRRTPAMVSWIDILPTLVELGGGPAPQGIDGRSFGAVLRGQTNVHRDRIFTTHSGDGRMNVYPTRSVRDDRWKYIRNLHPEYYYSTHVDLAQEGNGPGYFSSWVADATTNKASAALIYRYHEHPAEELYDLAADPYETKNLAADPQQAERLAKMRAEVTAWMKEAGDEGKTYGIPRLLTDPDRAKPPAAQGAAKKKKKID